MPLAADEAVALAVQFHDLSTDLSNYRFNNWAQLQDSERSQLEGIQWTLMNYSSDFATIAMTQTLAALPDVLQNIKSATQQANNALQTISLVAKIINIAAAAAVLGAAIASDNPSAVAQSIGTLILSAS